MSKQLIPIKPPKLPMRSNEAHKGLCGSVGVIGGGYGMLGAAVLAGRAAMRTGCGKVRVYSHASHVPLIALAQPELMSADAAAVNAPSELAYDALALGMGLGLDGWARAVFSCAIQSDRPKVIDADALTLLAETQAMPANAILTPHPGEAAKLLNTTAAKVQADRVGTVTQIAERYRAFCVLKGADTLVCAPSGEVSVNPTGNAILATAGSGDVLSGIIAGLLAQGLALHQAAQAGVWLHGTCGDQLLAARFHKVNRGVIATDIVNQIESALLACAD